MAAAVWARRQPPRRQLGALLGKKLAVHGQAAFSLALGSTASTHLGYRCIWCRCHENFTMEFKPHVNLISGKCTCEAGAAVCGASRVGAQPSISEQVLLTARAAHGRGRIEEKRLPCAAREHLVLLHASLFLI